jgi:hypothetical protein
VRRSPSMHSHLESTWLIAIYVATIPGHRQERQEDQDRDGAGGGSPSHHSRGAHQRYFGRASRLPPWTLYDSSSQIAFFLPRSRP